MASLGLTGLASGLDSETLISALLSTRQSGVSRLELQQRKVDARTTALNDVTTRLNNLQLAAKDLASVTLWKDTQTVESSDSTKLAARLLSPTGTGAYAIEVDQLARSAQRTFAFTAPTADTRISLQSASGQAVDIDVAAGATIAEVADALNSSEDSPVYAVAVNDRLVLSSRTSGEANGFTVTDGGGLLAEDPSRALAGLDAKYRVNGSSTVQSSATNTVTDAIPGVELTLKTTSPAGSPLVVTVSAPQADTAAAAAKVKAFVDQYNSTIDFIQSKVKEKKVPDATTESDRLKGVLFGDTALTGILSQLRVGIGQTFSELGNSESRDQLSEIGISTGASTGAATGAEALAGKLVLDEAKLSTALQEGRFDVKRLLAGENGAGGLSQLVSGLVEPYTKTDGVIDSRVKSGASEKSRIADAITSAKARIDAEEKRLRAQFAALESTLSANQSQQSWLSGQLNALYS